MQITAKYSETEDQPESKAMLLLGLWCLPCSWKTHAHCGTTGKLIYPHRVAEILSFYQAWRQKERKSLLSVTYLPKSTKVGTSKLRRNREILKYEALNFDIALFVIKLNLIHNSVTTPSFHTVYNFFISPPLIQFSILFALIKHSLGIKA